jgi:hypothetical protein
MSDDLKKVAINGERPAMIANGLLRVLRLFDEQGATSSEVHGAVVCFLVSWSMSQGYSEAQLVEVLSRDLAANFDKMRAVLLAADEEEGGVLH